MINTAFSIVVNSEALRRGKASLPASVTLYLWCYIIYLAVYMHVKHLII